MKAEFMRPGRVFVVLVLLGLTVRIWFVAAPSATALTFHSGGSDAPAYVLLAKNLVSHRGFSYAGQPSAFRPPGYPVLISGAMIISPRHWVLFVRWIQFFFGLATVLVCSLAALRLFDLESTKATCIAGIFLPTLIFPTAQILTECLAAMLTAMFLLFLIQQDETADRASALGLGVTAGLESLVRFNAAALPLLAGWTIIKSNRKSFRVIRLLTALLVPVLIVAPWIVRNEIIFHGRVLFSTMDGAVAVQGVVTPEGRTQVKDGDRLLHTMGWTISQLETNSPERLSLPSEADLNSNALKIVPGLWKALGWRSPLLLGKKVADFWLSWDQLADTKSFPLTERLVRFGGVVCYWVVLGLAIIGWFRLRKMRPSLASVLLIYAGGYTLLHLPLTMNTRLRIPLLEPLLAILAGAGWTSLMNWRTARRVYVPAEVRTT